MAIFGSDLLIAGCCEQFLEGTTALVTCVLSCTCNGPLATAYMQWFTCNANFHLMEMTVTSSQLKYNIKAYNILRLMVKTV